MNISTHGTAFTSYDVEANYKTKEAISKEKVSFDETIKQTNAVENVVYHTTTQADDAKPTTFIDPVTKKYVIASLENETLDKLRGKFGTDDVVEKEDGSIRLTGDAEAFVSGWFADIAYKREFLTADANSDGQLSEDEYKNVKNSYNSIAHFYTSGDGATEEIDIFAEEVTEQYVKYDKDNVSYRNHYNSDDSTSLDDELNMTINLDKDFDGNMTLEESYMETNKSLFNAIKADLISLGETAKMQGNSEVENLNASLGEIFDKFGKSYNKDISIVDRILNIRLDIFLQKDEKEQEKIMSIFNDMIESGKEPTKENIKQIYTQENIEQLKRLKDNTKENTNAKLERYS